ncbi:MAG TPA: polysaccharide deacetylase family protein [Bacteroidales bacterium]|nr:polysaccharide deacetylase family protein [Bacteroidales bacterium]
MLLVYSPYITPRVTYVFDLIFKSLIGIPYGITTDIEEFEKYSGPCLNYSPARIGHELFIETNDLLFEKNIRSLAIGVSEWNGTKTFFKTSENSDIPFDLFSASFFLISRYEEYLPSVRDAHNRFIAEDSIAFKNDFLQKPLVNIWAALLKQKIQVHYPEIVFTPPHYHYISTFDLDNVFCYRGKGLIRNAGGFVKSLLKLNFSKITERIHVLSGKINDPFDHYEFHRKLQELYRFPIIYFLLFAKKTLFDGALSPKSIAYKNLINSIKQYAEIGIHPSYFSGEKPSLFQQELQHLSKVTQTPITKSRQHFLKISFPDTYHNLMQAGITEDYSMGYPSHLGFRAGICTPFYFYDLSQETVTDLKIFPFCIMDSAMFDYMKIPSGNALQHIKKLVDEVKNVNGTLITIWHDRTFSNAGHYKGWKNVFEETVKMASIK